MTEDLKPGRETITAPNGTPRTTDVTASGSHFLKDFATCPSQAGRKHFYAHPNLEADPDNALGLTGVYTAEPLLAGSAIHDGIESWYRSRIRDGEDTGEGNLDLAISAVETGWANRSSEMASTDNLATLTEMTRTTVRRYHDHFTRGGPLSDYPNTTVVCDDQGEPWIERHFTLDLGHGFQYTARIDLVVRHNGYLATMDHKSSKASFVRQLLMMSELEAQFTGQLVCLQEHAPDLSVSGCIVNVLVKDRAKGAPFDRQLYHRSREQLELYRIHTIDLFQRIRDWLNAYHELLDRGYETERAFQIAFPMDGLRHGGCYAYYRKCDFWDLCANPGTASALVPTTFRPRRRVINETTEEQ